MEKTFAIIKPMAVQDGHADEIVEIIKSNGFNVDCMKNITMTQAEAQELYVEHKERPFFGEMVETMTASAVVVLQLSKDGAVKAWRDLMGATNPADAAEGTIRARFGKNIGHNATHGSDSLQSAKRELSIFFKDC